jgi:cysteine synthase A
MYPKNILNMIGHTPLLNLNLNIPKAKILVKLETYNLTGSIKDRMALFMLIAAKARGELKPGATIIEATTGNTGIAFSALARIFGYKMVAIMTADQTVERVKMMQSFGAKIILTPESAGVAGAIKKRDSLAKKTSYSWIPNQFDNPDNVLAHQKLTGPEIYDQLNGKIDYLVHGVGTGGTLVGIAKYLKKYFPALKVVAVEPSESAVLSGGKMGFHNIAGIGEGFIPSIVDLKIIDQVVKVSSKEAIRETKKLALKGLLVGYSSGANIAAIKKLAKANIKVKTYLTIFADRGERYLSTKLFDK